MYKKVILVILLLVILSGAGLGFFYYKKHQKKEKFIVMWSIYAGWMPWPYAYDNGIIKNNDGKVIGTYDNGIIKNNGGKVIGYYYPKKEYSTNKNIKFIEVDYNTDNETKDFISNS